MNTTAPSSAKKLATAEYLLKIIKAIGITQSAFAKRIGVSQPNFTDMLKGRRSYPKHIVLRMEQEFGIPFKKFMAMALNESVFDWYEQNKNNKATE